MPLRADDVEAAELLDALAELDVRAAAGHVGRDRDRALLPCIGDDLGFLFMELRVQHDVRDAVFLQDVRHLLGLHDGGRTDEDGLPRLVDLLDRLSDGAVLARLGLVDDVRLVDAADGLVRRDDDDGQLVDLEELIFLCLCRARHAREFVIHAEIVLECDARERLRLALDLDALLRLDRLMETVGVAAPLHEATRELIDDDDLIALHDVVAVAVHECLGTQCCRKAVRELDVLGCVEVRDADDLLDLRDSRVRRCDGLGLLIDGVVLALLQVADSLRHDAVVVRRLRAGTRDDERRARLVDEDGVHLVDDRIVQVTLHHLALGEHHVVAQIVKAELVVRAERHVGGIRRLALGEVHVMCDEADRQPEVAVEFAHPLAVAACKVVVDRDHVDALARERVEVDRRRRDERLALAGTHLGDAPLVEADAADQLYVKMPHAEHAARGLTHDGERLGEDLLHRLPLREPLTEFLRIARQFVIGEVHHRRLERVDLLHDAAVARDLLVVVVAEESLENRRYAEQIFHTPVLLVIINRLKDSIRFIIAQSPRLCIINVAEGG